MITLKLDCVANNKLDAKVLSQVGYFTFQLRKQYLVQSYWLK